MEKRSPVLNFSRSDLKWQITDLSQYQWMMKWTVPEGLPFFKGHFPKGAILPSVISLEASLELIGLVLNKEDILLKEVKTAKFFAPVTPGSKVVIKGKTKNSENHWLVDWFEECEKGEEGKIATFSLLL
tara:strand:- start:325 stop:711 length:387 start_codon:yes stop_codon:yes gene_type:complete